MVFSSSVQDIDGKEGHLDVERYTFTNVLSIDLMEEKANMKYVRARDVFDLCLGDTSLVPDF